MYKQDWFKKLEKEEILAINEKFWRNLSKSAYPVTKGKLKIPISLEPFIITKSEYRDLQKNLLLFVSAARKIADKYFVDDEIKKIVVINKNEKQLIKQSRHSNFVGIIRIDLFYAKYPKVVEINADFPDGLFMHDITSREIMRLSGLKVQYSNNSKLFDQLLKSEKVNKSDHIFVGYNKKRNFIDEFVLSKIQLNKLGWENVSAGAFEDLVFRKGQCYFQGKRVDVIRRGAELYKLRTTPHLIKNLIKAGKNSKLQLINNFKMRLLGHKSLLAALHDRRFHKYLTISEIESIYKLLPFTTKLDMSNINKLTNEKDLWVLKPSDLAEGENVAIGKSLAKTDWLAVIKKASRNPEMWVLQRRISIPQANFNTVDLQTGKVKSEKKKYDFNPHIVLFKDRNKFGNIISRFSDSDVLNVMKGGGLTYVFVKK